MAKYATLKEFLFSPDGPNEGDEREGSTLYIDNDSVSAYTDAGEPLLQLHLSEALEQALWLLNIKCEDV